MTGGGDKTLEYPHSKNGRVDPFHREDKAPFSDLTREAYAKCRARGETIKASCASAGITVQTGTVYEKHPEMRKRISELRAGAETYVGVSTAWCMRQVQQIMEEAREAGQYKVALESAQFIYKVVTEDKGVGQQMARALSPDVTAKDLKKLLKQEFAQPALPAYTPPTAPAEVESEGEAAE